MDELQKLAFALNGQDGSVRAEDVRKLLGTGKIGKPLKALGFRQIWRRSGGSRLYARGTVRQRLNADFSKGVFVPEGTI